MSMLVARLRGASRSSDAMPDKPDFAVPVFDSVPVFGNVPVFAVDDTDAIDILSAFGSAVDKRLFGCFEAEGAGVVVAPGPVEGAADDRRELGVESSSHTSRRLAATSAC